jgi:hypothetical protein
MTAAEGRTIEPSELFDRERRQPLAAGRTLLDAPQVGRSPHPRLPVMLDRIAQLQRLADRAQLPQVGGSLRPTAKRECQLRPEAYRLRRGGYLDRRRTRQ